MLNLVRRNVQKCLQNGINTSMWSRRAETTRASEASANLTPIRDSLKDWQLKLRDSGVGDIEFNLKCLVAHVLQQKFHKLKNYEDVQMTGTQMREFERLCEARCARMPLQHILGEWDFMNLTLKTAPTVFIPRPETEEFVHKVIEAYRDSSTPVNMLEVGCGSGAISLAILHALPHVRSTAIERSKAATALAWENAKMLNLHERFQVHNHTMTDGSYLPEALANEKYDLIVSNPPYVRSDEFQHLQPEVVVYENLNALDGGSDGLVVARLVLKLACEHLRSGGKLWLELGSEHPPILRTIMNQRHEESLRFVASFKDQYKRERFVEIEHI